MPAELKGRLVAEIHRSLPAELGFKKSRHRLIRDQPDFVESVQIQGSAWNSAGEPWRFYVNIQVRFPRVPSRLEAHVAHAECRLEALAPDMPPHFDLTPDSLQLWRPWWLAGARTRVERFPGCFPKRAKGQSKGCTRGWRSRAEQSEGIEGARRGAYARDLPRFARCCPSCEPHLAVRVLVLSGATVADRGARRACAPSLSRSVATRLRDHTATKIPVSEEQCGARVSSLGHGHGHGKGNGYGEGGRVRRKAFFSVSGCRSGGMKTALQKAESS